MKKSYTALFKKNLLSELYKHSGENIIINPIIEKYTGNIMEFEKNDKETPNIRLNLNGVLMGLKKMDWITISPVSGISNAHHRNPITDKMNFLFNDVIYVRMTEFGEAEYKKTLNYWYKHWTFAYIIYPVIVGILIWLLTTEPTKNKKDDIPKTNQDSTKLKIKSIPK